MIPGWTWISYPSADTLGFAEALGGFVPMQGDIIRSQWGQATYTNGRWRGSASQFYPGYGYKYYGAPLAWQKCRFVSFAALAAHLTGEAKFRDELKKGDKVVTIGGFHGKITEVKENTVMVSLAPEVTVEIEKSALVQNASQVGGQN